MWPEARALVQPFQGGGGGGDVPRGSGGRPHTRVEERTARHFRTLRAHFDLYRASVKLQLDPQPRDFTSIAVRAPGDDERLTNSITHGRSGTAMAPWEGVLTKEDIRRVIVYIRQRFTKTAAN